MHQLVIYIHEDQLNRLTLMAGEKGHTVSEEFVELAEIIQGAITEHLKVREDIRFLGQYTDVLVSEEIVKEIKTLLHAWNKIQMIKHCRDKCGFGLRDAKFVVDVLLGEEVNLA